MGLWGRKKLLTAGSAAPRVELARLDDAAQPLPELWGGGAVLLTFFKVSCPTCQLTLPFLDRLHRAGGALRVCYVSQNDAAETRAFVREYGLTAEMLRDPAPAYVASNAFGITHVPTLFLIEPDGTISLVSEGFVRADIEALGARAGVEVFTGGDYAPAFAPG